MMQDKELDNVYLELNSVLQCTKRKFYNISIRGDIDSLLILKENLEIEKRIQN